MGEVRMILKFLRSYFLAKANQYCFAGLSCIIYYPEDTMGYARGELLLKMGEVYGELAGALYRKEK